MPNGKSSMSISEKDSSYRPLYIDKNQGKNLAKTT